MLILLRLTGLTRCLPRLVDVVVKPYLFELHAHVKDPFLIQYLLNREISRPNQPCIGRQSGLDEESVKGLADILG